MPEKTIPIPPGLTGVVLGKNNKLTVLYALYGVTILLSDNYVTISSTDPVKLYNVEMFIRSNIGNTYVVFEHPSLITTLFVVDKDLPIVIRKYREDIQDKYRLMYGSKSMVRDTSIHAGLHKNNWVKYSRELLLVALERNAKPEGFGPYEVTIGRSTLYSASRDKTISTSGIYNFNTLTSLSIGYGKDVKVKWDATLTEKQVKYIIDKITPLYVTSYVKSSAIITGNVRMHCSVRIEDEIPNPSTFKTNVENGIGETIVIARLDSLPDIRYKFVTPSVGTSTVTYSDLLFDKDIVTSVTRGLYLTFANVDRITKYTYLNMKIKVIHNLYTDEYVIKFKPNDLKSHPIDVMDNIQNIFLSNVANEKI